MTNWLLSARTTVARPVSGPAVPERKTLGAAGVDREIEVVADAAGRVQGHGGVAIHVEGKLAVDLLAARRTAWARARR